MEGRQSRKVPNRLASESEIKRKSSVVSFLLFVCGIRAVKTCCRVRMSAGSSFTDEAVVNGEVHNSGNVSFDLKSNYCDRPEKHQKRFVKCFPALNDGTFDADIQPVPDAGHFVFLCSFPAIRRAAHPHPSLSDAFRIPPPICGYRLHLIEPDVNIVSLFEILFPEQALEIFIVPPFAPLGKEQQVDILLHRAFVRRLWKGLFAQQCTEVDRDMIMFGHVIS